MNKIIIGSDVKTSVFIGNQFLDDIGFYIPAQHSNSKIAIVTDDIVAKLHLNTIISSLEKYGFHPVIFIMSHGEENKAYTMLSQLIRFFVYNNITKTDLIITLGGGVVHDLAAFVCGMYLQRINFISIPTTFTSMIENTIGHAGHINTSFRKNHLSIPHYPLCVYIDVSTLSTLPQHQKKCGTAIAIKYQFIFDKKIIITPIENATDEELVNYITKLVRIKNNIKFINSSIIDPLILDFGSTIGGIIESHSGYQINQDEALAIGMAMMTKLSESKKLTKSGTYQALTDQLLKHNYPIDYSIPNEYFMKLIMNDRKFDGDVLNIVILKEIQKPCIHKINRKEIADFFTNLF